MEQATRIFNRMTKVEKIQLRMATPDGIAYLAREDYRGDLFGVNHADATMVLTEVRALCDLEFAQRSDLPFGTP